MPEDPERHPPPAGGDAPSRRDVLTRLGVGACAVAAAGSGAFSGLSWTLRAATGASTTGASAASVAGRPSVSDLLLTKGLGNRVRRVDAAGVFAMSAVCTHLGCITRHVPDEGAIACPCHGSRFDLEGNVTHGPAPRPLPWLEVTLDADGNLVVDTSVVIPRGKVFRT